MYKTCELGERSLNCCLLHGRDYVECLLQHISEFLLSEKISICLQVPRMKSSGRDKISLQKLLWLHSTVLASPEKEMATHSTTLARKIPGQGSLVGCSPWSHEESDTTEWLHFHFSFSCIGGGNGNPLHCSCLENPRDRGAWWAAVYGVAQSRTGLKRLSSSSSSAC